MLLSDGESVRILSDGRRRHAYLALEFAVLFIVLPTLYMSHRPLLIHPFPAIWGFAALCVWVLRRNGGVSLENLWGELPGKKQIRIVLTRFAIIAGLLSLYVLFFEPDKLLAFPRRNPAQWLLFVVLYPIISVIPQGIVYRVFIFRRYEGLFGNGWPLVVASGLVFSYAHIIYRNPIAIILTLFGGFFFAHTHARSNSPGFSHIEHALYGNFVFTIGLGYYIYSGTMR
ncbi:MAG: CPBP family glutamic-type intramembrane protease [Syntrophobacteraceae bacterium]